MLFYSLPFLYFKLICELVNREFYSGQGVDMLPGDIYLRQYFEGERSLPSTHA
jgi:hypothetical protein